MPSLRGMGNPCQPGSHLIMRRDNPFAPTVVPAPRELNRGTLRAILRQTDSAVEDFTRLLGGPKNSFLHPHPGAGQCDGTIWWLRWEAFSSYGAPWLLQAL